MQAIPANRLLQLLDSLSLTSAVDDDEEGSLGRDASPQVRCWRTSCTLAQRHEGGSLLLLYLIDGNGSLGAASAQSCSPCIEEVVTPSLCHLAAAGR